MHTEKDLTLRCQRAAQYRFLIIISIISGMLLCCKNMPVLLWGPLFGRTCLNPPLGARQRDGYFRPLTESDTHIPSNSALSNDLEWPWRQRRNRVSGSAILPGSGNGSVCHTRCLTRYRVLTCAIIVALFLQS